MKSQRSSLSELFVGLQLHQKIITKLNDYELVPSDSPAATDNNLNCVNLNQDLGQAPKDSQFDSAQEGKPQSITHYFPHYYSSNYSYML